MYLIYTNNNLRIQIVTISTQNRNQTILLFFKIVKNDTKCVQSNRKNAQLCIKQKQANTTHTRNANCVKNKSKQKKILILKLSKNGQIDQKSKSKNIKIVKNAQTCNKLKQKKITIVLKMHN